MTYIVLIVNLYIDILTYYSSGETRPVKVIDGVMKNGELHDLNANLAHLAHIIYHYFLP